MSVSEQILRIQTARNTIRSKLVSLGLAASSADIDDCATAVDGITNQGAVSVEILEGKTYTIPAGYHNGAGIVKALTDREGDITERYKTQAKSVTPTKSQQPITPDEGYYALESVMVEAIPENYQDVTPVTATAADVLANKIIVDSTGKSIAGTMRNNGSKSGGVASGKQSYTIPAGYHDGTGVISAATTSKTVTPTKSTQTVTGNDVVIKREDGTTFHDRGLLTTVTVNPIPDAYQDVTGVTAAAANVLEDTYFVTASGALTEGTMKNRGAYNIVFNPLNGSSDDSSSGGYYVGVYASCDTSKLEEALAAI